MPATPNTLDAFAYDLGEKKREPPKRNGGLEKHLEFSLHPDKKKP